MKGVEQSEALKSCWLRSAVLIRFFLQAPLNGNFFKLKHLYAFLEQTLDAVVQRTSSSSPSTNADLIETLSDDEISRPFEYSAKSAYVLGEIVKFLKTPCVYSVFKAALDEKRRSQVSLVGGSTALSTTTVTTVTTNNNDENFSNMNVSETRTLQLKSMTINSGSSVVAASSGSGGGGGGSSITAETADIIHRSPLNGNY